MTLEDSLPPFLGYVYEVLADLGGDVVALVAVGSDGLPQALWSWPSASTAVTLDTPACEELSVALDETAAQYAHLVVLTVDPEHGQAMAAIASDRLSATIKLAGIWEVSSERARSLLSATNEPLPPCDSEVLDVELLHSTRLAALVDWRHAIELVCAGQQPQPEHLTRMRCALADALTRDAMIVDLIPGQEGVAEALCHDGHARGLREGLARIFAPHSGVPAPREALTAAIKVAELIHSSRPSAHALGVAALAWWWLDDPIQASLASSRSMSVDPMNRLSTLVQAAVMVGMRPGWRAQAA